jgi:hypothetical protein
MDHLVRLCLYNGLDTPIVGDYTQVFIKYRIHSFVPIGDGVDMLRLLSYSCSSYKNILFIICVYKHKKPYNVIFSKECQVMPLVFDNCYVTVIFNKLCTSLLYVCTRSDQTSLYS